MKNRSFDLYNPITWISIGFGAGLSPIAPGTLGSLFAAVIYFFLINPLILNFLDIVYFVFFLCGSYILGIYAYNLTVEGDQDPDYFVWDEFIGMWISCLPMIFIDQDSIYLILAFIIFRLFDILKPWPIVIFDRKESALGVMLDDIVAGLMTIPFSVLIYLFIS
jgi:phosphatidylglycerophosphatase A